MLEVLFDIPTLKKLYPELNRCFGFTYDDIWKIQCKLPPKTKRFCPLVLK